MLQMLVKISPFWTAKEQIENEDAAKKDAPSQRCLPFGCVLTRQRLNETPASSKFFLPRQFTNLVNHEKARLHPVGCSFASGVWRIYSHSHGCCANQSPESVWFGLSRVEER